MEIRIVSYDRNDHGEQTGNLWFNGLWEMMTPFYRNTMLHYKVLAVTILAWALHIAWLLRLANGNDSDYAGTGTNSTSIVERLLLVPSSMSIWTWLVPMLFLIAQIGWFALIKVIHYRLKGREIRIDDPPRRKDLPPEWRGHWVALQSRSQESQTTLSEEKKVIGCVTLSRQQSSSDSDENLDEHEEPTDGDGTASTCIWCLSHLTVSPEHRKNGLATRLAHLVETKAKEQGATSIRILVGNVNSKQFWLKRGYAISGVKWKVLGHESIFMERTLR